MNFYPTRNFGHFWAALSKMSLNFSKFLGRLRRHTVSVSSSVSSSCLLLWPWLRSLSHGGPCSLHVVLGLAWLPPPMVTGFFEIAQSFQHRTVKKTKKTQKKTKMNRNKQQRKTRSWPTLAKPTLANRVWPALFGDRVWPIRLWPALVF